MKVQVQGVRVLPPLPFSWTSTMKSWDPNFTKKQMFSCLLILPYNTNTFIQVQRKGNWLFCPKRGLKFLGNIILFISGGSSLSCCLHSHVCILKSETNSALILHHLQLGHPETNPCNINCATNLLCFGSALTRNKEASPSAPKMGLGTWKVSVAMLKLTCHTQHQTWFKQYSMYLICQWRYRFYPSNHILLYHKMLHCIISFQMIKICT